MRIYSAGGGRNQRQRKPKSTKRAGGKSHGSTRINTARPRAATKQGMHQEANDRKMGDRKIEEVNAEEQPRMNTDQAKKSLL